MSVDNVLIKRATKKHRPLLRLINKYADAEGLTPTQAVVRLLCRILPDEIDRNRK